MTEKELEELLERNPELGLAEAQEFLEMRRHRRAQPLLLTSPTGLLGTRLTPFMAGGTSRDEHQEQALLMRWVRANETVDPRLRLLFAVPNGGGRTKSQAMKLQAEGVRPGVPDLLMPVQCRGHVGLALEMKVRPAGRVRPEQKEWMAALREQGWYTEVCWSGWEAHNVLMWYLGYADRIGESTK